MDGGLPTLFRLVPGDELSSVWPRVEIGCKAILRKAERRGTSIPWNATDVYRRLRRQQAFLLLAGDGFAVIERDAEPMSQDPFLRVWLMWMPNAAKPLRAQLIAELDAMKKGARCEWIQFESPFAGWEAIEPDFTRHMTIWRRK